MLNLHVTDQISRKQRHKTQHNTQDTERHETEGKSISHLSYLKSGELQGETQRLFFLKKERRRFHRWFSRL